MEALLRSSLELPELLFQLAQIFTFDLPAENWVLLRAIAHHLARLAQQPTNKMSLDSLMVILSPTLRLSPATLLVLVQHREVIFDGGNDDIRRRDSFAREQASRSSPDRAFSFILVENEEEEDGKIFELSTGVPSLYASSSLSTLPITTPVTADYFSIYDSSIYQEFYATNTATTKSSIGSPLLVQHPSTPTFYDFIETLSTHSSNHIPPSALSLRKPASASSLSTCQTGVESGKMGSPTLGSPAWCSRSKIMDLWS